MLIITPNFLAASFTSHSSAIMLHRQTKRPLSTIANCSQIGHCRDTKLISCYGRFTQLHHFSNLRINVNASFDPFCLLLVPFIRLMVTRRPSSQPAMKELNGGNGDKRSLNNQTTHKNRSIANSSDHERFSNMSFSLLEPSRHDVYPFIDPRDGLKDTAAGKIVLVTGSGGGIGRAIAESFALAGASELVLVARRTEPLEQTKIRINELAPSCKVFVFGGVDISDQHAVKTMFDALQSPPDVLVSNAAVSLETATVMDSDPAKVCTEIDINFKGMYLMAHYYMNAVNTAGKQGCLINVSSNASWRFIPGRASYATTKAATNLISEYIHREEEANGGGVRCVAMHPGGVITELSHDLPEDIRRVLIDTPALPGGTAVYLSTDRARFLMGRFVQATCDMEEMEKLKERVEQGDLLKTRVLGVKGQDWNDLLKSAS